MRRVRLTLRAAASVLLLAFVTGCGTTPDVAPVQLTVIHVNDTHQHMFPFSTPEEPRVQGGAARLATAVAQARGGGSPVLLLHGGDSLVGSAATYFFNGRPDYVRLPTYGYRGLESVEVMNQIGFDAMVIGNHELDYGKRWLEGLMGRARFPIVSANVLKREIPDIDGSPGTPLAQPYVILQKGGLRIGIIGLTTEEFTQSTQVKVSDPMAAAVRLVPEVAGKSDLLIVLSHLGYKLDLDLAQRVPGIDLIVGGHSHTLVPEPVMIGSTLVAQAGSHLRQVGILDLTVARGKIISYRYRMKPLDESVETDPAVDATLRRYLAIGSVGDKPLRAVAYQRNDIGSLATAAMLGAADAEVAMVPADAFYGELGPGAPGVQQFFNVFWPYRSRSQLPEKDMNERQLLSTMNTTPNAALRTLIRGSNGLRTLVVARVPSQALASWRTLNEGRSGDADYVQVDDRGQQGREQGSDVSVVMPLDLALRMTRLGLPIDPQRLQVTATELFEAVLSALAKGQGAAGSGR